MSAAAREAFLAERRVGILSIARADGQPPLATPVWYSYEPGADLAINVGRTSEKVRLLTSSPVASLTVQDEQLPPRFVTVGGPVSVEPADDDTRREIASRYLPADMVDGYLSTGELDDMATLRLAPSSWRSNDFSLLG